MSIASLLTGKLKQVRNGHLLRVEKLQKDAFTGQRNLQQSPRLGTRSLSGVLALSCPIHWHLVRCTNWRQFVAFPTKDSPVSVLWLTLIHGLLSCLLPSIPGHMCPWASECSGSAGTSPVCPPTPAPLAEFNAYVSTRFAPRFAYATTLQPFNLIKKYRNWLNKSKALWFLWKLMSVLER